MSTDGWAMSTDGWAMSTDGWAMSTDGWAMSTDGRAMSTDGWAMRTDGWAMRGTRKRYDRQAAQSCSSWGVKRRTCVFFLPTSSKLNSTVPGTGQRKRGNSSQWLNTNYSGNLPLGILQSTEEPDSDLSTNL